MQNTRSAHKLLSIKVFGIMLAAFLLPVFSLALVPSAAQAAGTYTITNVDISADISDAGAIHIVENRSFDSADGATTVRWPFPGFPSNATVQVNEVTLRNHPDGAADFSGGEARAIPGMPFQAGWRSSGAPEGESYSWDGAEHTLYIFTNGLADLDITVDYTVTNGINAYKDVGELYWQYIPAAWPVNSENVTATITLPVPTSQKVTPGSNVRAWGHGPLDGSLSFNDEGGITYVDSLVKAGQYAEARVVFPISWLPNLSDSSRELHENEDHLQAALADEETWADTANAQRIQGIAFMAFWLVLSLVLLGWALACYHRWGRDFQPQFGERYWRTAPDEELPPAVIGRLLAWNKPQSSQLIATLLNLATKEVVRIGRAGPTESVSATSGAFSLALVPEMLDRASIDTLEEEAVLLAFGEGPTKRLRLSPADIQRLEEGRDEERSKALLRWHGMLTEEVAKAGLFEEKGVSLRKTMTLVAAGYLAVGLCIAITFGTLLPLGPIVLTSLLLAVIAHFMPRRTQRGAEVAARARALERWLTDLPKLGKQLPADDAAQGKLMPYAYLFGIADGTAYDSKEL